MNILQLAEASVDQKTRAMRADWADLLKDLGYDPSEVKKLLKGLANVGNLKRVLAAVVERVIVWGVQDDWPLSNFRKIVQKAKKVGAVFPPDRIIQLVLEEYKDELGQDDEDGMKSLRRGWSKIRDVFGSELPADKVAAIDRSLNQASGHDPKDQLEKMQKQHERLTDQHAKLTARIAAHKEKHGLE